MRLPFGLGRRSGSGDGAPSSGPAAPSPAPAQPAAGPSRAWASLPPIQRAAGDMPLVAGPGAFVEALPGSRGLPPIVEPLGHEVSNLATPGLVLARVHPVERSGSGSIPPPVQRRAARGAAGHSESAWAGTTAAETRGAVQPSEASTAPASVAHATGTPRAAGSPTAATAPIAGASPLAAASPVSVMRSAAPDETPASGGGPGGMADEPPDLPVVAPIRTMPTVSRTAVRVPDRPLTSAATAAVPALQRAQAAGASAAGVQRVSAAGLPLPVPSGGMRRAQGPSTAPRPGMPMVSRQAGPDVGPAAPSTAAATEGPSSSSPLAADAPQLPSLPELAKTSSRRGLGEPLTAPPTAAQPLGSGAVPVVSRSTMDGPIRTSASSILETMHQVAGDSPALAAALVAPASRAAEPSAAGGSPPTPGAGGPAAQMPLPQLPVARQASDGPATRAAAGRGAAPRPAFPGAGATAEPLSPALPLQRARPGAPSAATTASASPAGVQRLVATPRIRPIAAANPLRPSIALQRDDDGDDHDDDGSAMPSPWWTPAAAADGMSATPGASRAQDVAAAVQRSAFDAAGPARAAASTVPPGVRGTVPASGLGSASRLTGVQRSTRASAPLRMPLAVPASDAGRSAASMAAAAAASAPAASSFTPPAGSITSEPTVQAVRDPRSTPPARPSAGGFVPTLQRETGGGSSESQSQTASANELPRTERDFDELAGRLFDRLRTRLRRDLLHDREAAGFTFDNI